MDSIALEMYRAHLWSSTEFMSSNNGLVQGYWQPFLLKTISPFVAIGNIVQLQ